MPIKLKKPRDQDVAIGARIRLLRKNVRMSQSDLGKELGVTFQQIQKYENGRNRVSGSTMHKMCSALKTTPNYLLGINGAGIKPNDHAVLSVANELHLTRVITTLAKIPDPQKRAAVCKALEIMVEAFK